MDYTDRPKIPKEQRKKNSCSQSETMKFIFLTHDLKLWKPSIAIQGLFLLKSSGTTCFLAPIYPSSIGTETG